MVLKRRIPMTTHGEDLGSRGGFWGEIRGFWGRKVWVWDPWGFRDPLDFGLRGVLGRNTGIWGLPE